MVTENCNQTHVRGMENEQKLKNNNNSGKIRVSTAQTMMVHLSFLCGASLRICWVRWPKKLLYFLFVVYTTIEVKTFS
jgi:hypothetical protein